MRIIEKTKSIGILAYWSFIISWKEIIIARMIIAAMMCFSSFRFMFLVGGS